MLKKKLFGIPIALIMIGLLVVGGATAALVSYLSNTVSADTTVRTPLTLKINDEDSAWGGEAESISLGTLYGGDTATFYVKEENRGTSDVTSDLVINITNEMGVDSCDELQSVTFENVEAGSSQNITDDCHHMSAKDQLQFIVDSQSMPSGETNTYKIDVTFALDAHGTYTADAQHTPDSS